MLFTSDHAAILMAVLALGTAIFTAGMHVATLRRLGRDMDRVVADMARVATLSVQVHENTKSMDEIWHELRDYRSLPPRVSSLEQQIKDLHKELYGKKNGVREDEG